jgi:hypothetical protein
MLNEQSALEHEEIVGRLTKRFATEEPGHSSLHDSALYRMIPRVQGPVAHSLRAPWPDSSSLHRPREHAAPRASRRADGPGSSALVSIFGSNLDDLPPQPSRASATERGIPKLSMASPSSAKRIAPHIPVAKAQPMTASQAAAILRGHKVPDHPGVRPNLKPQHQALLADLHSHSASARAPARAIRKLPIPGALYEDAAVRVAGPAKPAAYKIKKQPMPPSPSIAKKKTSREMSVHAAPAESKPKNALVPQAVPRSPSPRVPRERPVFCAREPVAGGVIAAASVCTEEHTSAGRCAPALADGERLGRRPTLAEAMFAASNASRSDGRFDGGFSPSAMRNAAGGGGHSALPPAYQTTEPGPVELDRWADRRERALMARAAAGADVTRQAAAAAAPAAPAAPSQDTPGPAALKGRLTLLPVDDLLGNRGPSISTRRPRATAAISPRAARLLAAQQAHAADVRERKEHALIQAMRRRQEQGMMAARRACAEL